MTKDKEIIPVMIAGCGRSGTSLLRTLIDAHPDIAIPSESHFIIDYLKYSKNLPVTVWRSLLYREPQLLCWYDGLPQDRSSIQDEIISIHRRYAELNGAIAWGQKTPRFIRHRHLIDSNIGPCRWILIYRDPRAVYASMRASGQHTNSIRRACLRWNHDNEPILDSVNKKVRDDDGTTMHIKYEDFIRNPERGMTEILKFLGLDHICFQELLKNAQPVFFSRSKFKNNTVRRGVVPELSRVDSWKRVLTEREIYKIQVLCGAKMRAFGYQMYDTFEKRPPIYLDVIQRISDIRIAFRYLKYWPEYALYTLRRKLLMRVGKMWYRR